MDSSLKRGFLELLILKCLDGRRLHGYALLKDLEQADAKHFQASEGSLYPLLARLEREGLIKSSWVERRRECCVSRFAGRQSCAHRRSDDH
jgi:PadR family transcriptional regulator PadR